jgi:outer membrane protein assembly factor BamB
MPLAAGRIPYGDIPQPTHPHPLPPPTTTPPHSTDITGIKATSIGRRALYFTTWAGPGLYAVALTSGRVRWQFPLNNWFAYWRKEIDLPPSASFADAGESGANAAFATAAGPPARVYGLHAKHGGDQEWEWKADSAAAALTDIAGPDMGEAPRRASMNTHGGGSGSGNDEEPLLRRSSTEAGVLYLSLSITARNISWLQALSLADGAPLWTSAPIDDAVFSRVEIDGGRLLVADRDASRLLAFDKATGELLWDRPGRYCPTPSPIGRVYSAGRRGAAGARPGGGEGEGDGGAEDDDGSSGSSIAASRRRLAEEVGGKGSGSSGADDHAGAAGVLLLARDCDGLDGLTALDSATGRELWLGFDAPRDERPDGSCSWVEAAEGTAFFGCNCEQQTRPGPPAAGNDLNGVVCLYAVSLSTGRRAWSARVEMDAAGGFTPNAQAWGRAPLFLDNGVVAFVTNSTVLGVEASSGKPAWSFVLESNEWIESWQGATVAYAEDRSGRPVSPPLILLHALRGARNKTSLYAVSGASGDVEWARAFNGSMQPPLAPVRGGAAPLLVGGRVVSEMCRRRRCCLQALDVSTGKSAWSMCLDAVRGTDPTNPRAQFAIWVVTLVTIASMAALVLGAALLYVNRWADERSLISGGAGAGAGGSGGNESDSEYEPLRAGVRRVGAGGGGGGGGAAAGGGGVADGPRLSLFARSGGAATTVLGGPPSPGSLAAAAYLQETGGPPGGDGGGGRSAWGLGLGRLFGGRRQRAAAQEAAPPAGGAAAGPPAARSRPTAVPWRAG